MSLSVVIENHLNQHPLRHGDTVPSGTTFDWKVTAVRRTDPPGLELSCPSLTDWLILLDEPADTDGDALFQQVLSGSYDRPFLVDDGVSRTLYFSLTYVQSMMRLADPIHLELAYTRKMMGFMLFRPNPVNILLLGLGGGSLAKFCYRELPATRIDAVELDPRVLAFRAHFHVPADDERFTVVEGDAAAHVLTIRQKYSVVLLDVFDRDGIAGNIGTRQFYQAVRAGLDRDGVLVANLAGARKERIAHLEILRAVFRGNVLVLHVPEDGNHVAFAFRNPGYRPRWDVLQPHAQDLQMRTGLEFPEYAKQLAGGSSWI